jgi:fatty acid desaturase
MSTILRSADGATDLANVTDIPPDPDDRALLQEAARLARALNGAKPGIYWADFLVSVALGYGALALAIGLVPLGMKVAAALVATLALYRASSFMHELTHLKPSAVPGFRTAWNLLIGIPLMVPSFMYEGVHTLHHARTRYGTAADPEYLPLAAMKPRAIILFVAVAAVTPFALLVRYALLAPLSAVSPGLRRRVVERYSALAINPAFRRPLPTGAVRRIWLPLEVATSLWTIGLLAAVATGLVPMAAFATFFAIMAAIWLLNQLRTLVAHRWQNDGGAISVAAQYLDSVNVPPPGVLPALWAPVGLRYHALHHLLPSVPYHALGEAHRRMAAAMPQGSLYYRANYRSLSGLVAKLLRRA